MRIFSSKNPCVYAPECSGYREDSHTCTEELDKSYCGLFSRLERGDT